MSAPLVGRRIGVLTTSYPRFEGDVAGLFVRSMAVALAARGHSLEVLAPCPAEPAIAPPPRDEGVTLEWVRYAPRGLHQTFYGAGVPDNVRRDVRAWPGLATYPLALRRAARARVGGWDALISHWALPSAIVGGAVAGGRPHLAVLHSADVHLVGRLPASATWAAAVGRSADQLLFASSALRDRLLAHLPPLARADLARRCHACAMGVDPGPEVEGRRALRARLGLRRFTVLALGRLVPIKGVDRLVDAMAGLPEGELVVVGEGPERERLERRALRRGVSARFLGTKTGVEKTELLRAADAFVLASRTLPSGRTEGTPTSALEAALAGVPIVATRAGGLPEVLEHERSALFVDGDPGALARALRRLEGDPGLRRRLGRGAARVARRYEWSALAPRIELLLQR